MRQGEDNYDLKAFYLPQEWNHWFFSVLFFLAQPPLICTPLWSEGSLFDRKKEEEDQRWGEEKGWLIIAGSESLGNGSHVTCVGICLIFPSVWKCFDLLSLSFHNELFCPSCSSSLSVGLTGGTCDLPLHDAYLKDHSLHSRSDRRSICLELLRRVLMSRSWVYLALESSVSINLLNKSEEFQRIKMKELVDHSLQHP